VTESEIRKRVIRAFEAAREARGGAWEPERFLAFLTRKPAKTGKRVADTFAGRRRFVRFVEAMQLELGVCFTNEDWERGLGLDEFVSLVAAKVEKPDVALRLAERRVTESRARLVADPVKFAILFAPLLVAALAFPPLAALWLVTPLGVAWLARRDWQYAQRLAGRIARG
jgi:hypothetical protein